MNFTVVVPEGTSNHGDPKLICLIPHWHDYLVFYLTNYLVHAATLVTFPGQSVSESISYALAALLLPSYGVLRIVKLLFIRPGWEKDPLRRAASAGALYMVVARRRKEDLASYLRQKEQNWRPRFREKVTENLYIHGLRQLPPDYELIKVPMRTPLHWRQRGGAGWDDTNGDPFLASSYNVPKVVVSLLQSVWAIVTLYQARGNQIDRYGYAAFGLTVAPYAFMSAVNILANLVMPEYPAMFIVHTTDLEKAIQEGAVVEGVVAEIDMDAFKTQGGQLNLGYWSHHYSELGYYITIWVLTLTPLIIIAGLSRFAAGESSSMQRGFIMSWYVVSIACGVIPYWQDSLNPLAWILTCSILAPSAIGGMVMVGLEIKEYGVCTKIW